MLAAEAVSCLNKALCHLKDIWEEIGIPEDQRLQRTNVVKSHIKVGVHSLHTERPIRNTSSPVSGEGVRGAGGGLRSTASSFGWCPAG